MGNQVNAETRAYIVRRYHIGETVASISFSLDIDPEIVWGILFPRDANL